MYNLILWKTEFSAHLSMWQMCRRRMQLKNNKNSSKLSHLFPPYVSSPMQCSTFQPVPLSQYNYNGFITDSNPAGYWSAALLNKEQDEEEEEAGNRNAV